MYYVHLASQKMTRLQRHRLFWIIDDFIVVADFGFIIKRNVELLRCGSYDFIIGARIKKCTPKVKE